MPNPVHTSANLIYSAGSQVIVREQKSLPGEEGSLLAGTIGVIVSAPAARSGSYLVRFADETMVSLLHDEIQLLREYCQVPQNSSTDLAVPREMNVSELEPAFTASLYQRIIFRCVIGSRAYGLDDEKSDTDRRGIFLPPATAHWSLGGVPEQLENEEAQETYWELQKFLTLALKANPNVLECLYSPIVETATPLAQELLDMRGIFVSKLVYQTFNGYALSQFKKIGGDLRNQGRVKWKHVMHLIRLLLSGIDVLREGTVHVDVGDHRDKLLAIKAGEIPWEDVSRWRLDLHQQFDEAYAETKLPERPDYGQANAFLIKARELATRDQLP